MFSSCSALLRTFLRLLSRNLLNWDPFADDVSRSAFVCLMAISSERISRNFWLPVERDSVMVLEEHSLFPLSVSLLNVDTCRCCKNIIPRSCTLESFLPPSTDDDSLSNMFLLSRSEANETNRNFFQDNEKKLLLLLFISWSLFRFFHGLLEAKETKEERNGTGNSLEREQQQIINKILIDGEAQACIHVEHSYLNIEEFSVISQVKTFRLNWFNGNERGTREQKARKKPETIGISFMFKPQCIQSCSQTHTYAAERCMRPTWPNTSQAFSIVIIAFGCLQSFLNLPSVKSFISNGRTEKQMIQITLWPSLIPMIGFASFKC